MNKVLIHLVSGCKGKHYLLLCKGLQEDFYKISLRQPPESTKRFQLKTMYLPLHFFRSKDKGRF